MQGEGGAGATLAVQYHLSPGAGVAELFQAPLITARAVSLVRFLLLILFFIINIFEGSLGAFFFQTFFSTHSPPAPGGLGWCKGCQAEATLCQAALLGFSSLRVNR